MKAIRIKMISIDENGNSIGSYTFQPFNFNVWVQQPFIMDLPHYQKILRKTRNGNEFIINVKFNPNFPFDYGYENLYNAIKFIRF